MKIVRSASAMQKTALGLKKASRSISFVPTMGALHEGHLSLVRRARKLGDKTVVSIFVNPAQFAPGEDLSRYPRSPIEDARLLRSIGVDFLFMPAVEDVYPAGFSTCIDVEGITSVLEGNSRPGHFRGVATMVGKLFNIVQPDVAVFGQKDAQQAAVIRKMAKDLNFPLKIVVAPTVREKSGLAMSSRNRYFNEEQKSRAACIYDALRQAALSVKSGETDCRTLVASVESRVRKTRGTSIDYVAITHRDTFEELKELKGKALLSVAIRLDGVRLIDNIVLSK